MLHGDPRLPGLLRVGAIVVGNYCVYAALVGALNGRKRFKSQAALDMTFATLRTVLVIGLAATALQVWGALVGFAVASAVIVLVALGLLRRDVARAPVQMASAVTEPFGVFARRYARFFAPVLLYQLALNMVLQSDLLVVGTMLGFRGVDHNHVEALLGVYKGVQNFAFLPYQLLLAVTFVLFPTVSTATREGDRETAMRVFRGAMRFSSLALGAMLAVLAGLPTQVLRLAYRPAMAVGGPALRVLAIGQGAFALSVIATTVILAAGRTRAATALMMAMLAAVFAGDVVGIAVSPSDTRVLAGAAMGTAAGCVVGMLGVAAYARRVLGAFVPLATAARALLATALSAGLATWLGRPGKLFTLVEAAAVVLVYVGVLIASGELGREERAQVARILARRPAR
jgi:stage V sporulation protein B